ncbi:hypothetical protein [Ancrocorticia populi]|uniref:hypothetical protein n=1 Tax=Ancrocorticia populi TaxID=2175228 RepID=UPI0023551B6B|nr:hypothetical protein [Ancrocorticia populi]
MEPITIALNNQPVTNEDINAPDRGNLYLISYLYASRAKEVAGPSLAAGFGI